MKKALPILSTIAMFVPGIGTAIGGALKIASAAVGAYDAIKSKNPLAMLGSVAGAFTGGAGNLLGKAQNFLGNTGVGGVLSKGIDLYSKGKDWLSNVTSGLGGSVTNWLNSSSSGLLRSFAAPAGEAATSWLNQKASNVFGKLFG